MIAGGFYSNRRRRGQNGWRFAACSANSKEREFVFTQKFSSVIRQQFLTVLNKGLQGRAPQQQLTVVKLGATASSPARARPPGARTSTLHGQSAGRLDAAPQQPSIPGPETWPRRYRAFKVSLSEGNGLQWWDGERGEDKISEDKQAL